LRKTTEPGASPDVRGAPPGSAVLAQGQPRGSTVPKEPLSVRKRPASLDPIGLHTAKECTSPSALEDAAADAPPFGNSCCGNLPGKFPGPERRQIRSHSGWMPSGL